MNNLHGNIYNFTRWSALIIIFTVFAIGLTHGQEDDNSQRLLLDIDSDYLEFEQISELVAIVSELLEADGIEIVGVEGDYPRLILIESNADGTMVSIASDSPRQLANSDFLEPHYAHGFSIYDLESDEAIQAIVGFAHYALGNYETTLEYFEGLNFSEANYDLSPAIDFYIANSYLALGNYQNASTYFISVMDAFYGNNLQALNNLSWSLLQMTDDVEYAASFYDFALANSNNQYRVTLLSHRAQIFALGFDYDSAIADMDEAITIAEENELDNRTLAELYTIRGEIIFLIYEWDRVEDNFDMAIELDPTYAPAYFQRGVLFYTMLRRDNARADFETYLDLDPDGIYAEAIEGYIESIEIELEALGE